MTARTKAAKAGRKKAAAKKPPAAVNEGVLQGILDDIRLAGPDIDRFIFRVARKVGTDMDGPGAPPEGDPLRRAWFQRITAEVHKRGCRFDAASLHAAYKANPDEDAWVGADLIELVGQAARAAAQARAAANGGKAGGKGKAPTAAGAGGTPAGDEAAVAAHEALKGVGRAELMARVAEKDARIADLERENADLQRRVEQLERRIAKDEKYIERLERQTDVA
jgi:hypothetical protein